MNSMSTRVHKNITYTPLLISEIVGCGGTLGSWQQGTITSPGYPSGYGAGIECVWRVLSPTDGARLSVRLLDLDLRLPLNASASAAASSAASSGLVGSCVSEMLELYDSQEPNAAQLVARFCARDAADIARVRIGSNCLLVFFSFILPSIIDSTCVLFEQQQPVSLTSSSMTVRFVSAGESDPLQAGPKRGFRLAFQTLVN